MNEPSAPKCPQCGASLPANAPAGLCPNCLMALNLKTETLFTDDSPAAQPPLPPDQIAPHFPQLEILECLGRGGMGVVYKARQKALGRLVALKLLAPERVNDPRFSERFTREAQALAALNHPNIVTIYDFGRAGGFYFLLMEFVDGVNLRHLLRSRKLSPEEALAIVPPLCDALQFAHERGIVHRDIKPENLLLDKNGRVKVADFGIAKMLGAGIDGSVKESSAPDNATKTALGTPGYSAPEQMTDPARVDSRADIYSLGTVFYEMLTGELPGKRIEPPSKKVQIDVRLDAIVMRALEKTPELRWQTAADLRTQVETITGSTGANCPPAKCFPLNRMRASLLVWSFAVALACTIIAPVIKPVLYGWAIGIWGVLLFIVCATLVFAFGDNLKMFRIAIPLVLIDGAVWAFANFWLGFHATVLPAPWLLVVVMACLVSLGCSLSWWTKLNELDVISHGSPPPVKSRFSQWFRKVSLVNLPVAIGSLLVIQVFFLEPFKAANDSAAPEIPRGSQFLVWKFSHRFVPGDLIAYRLNGWPVVGRVVSNQDGILSVNRNGKADICVLPADILGKVISVYWRASQAASPVTLHPVTDDEPGSFQNTAHSVNARAVSLRVLISYAYGPATPYLHWSGKRVILPPDVADGKFDFQFTSDDLQGTLQVAIQKQLGLVARRELLETNVQLLEVSNPGMIGAQVATGGNSSDSRLGHGEFEFANEPIGDLGDFLEDALRVPVINATGLDQKYSGSLKWNPQSDQAANLNAIQTALSGQLGLELVPGRQPIEFLIVEKAK